MIEPYAADRFFVLTGGPGSGKTTLLDRLMQSGFATTGEAGRGVIKDQAAIGGPALPWADRQLFAELMLSWEMRSYRHAAQGRHRKPDCICGRTDPHVVCRHCIPELSRSATAG